MVADGESIASISKEYGYLWTSVWDHGNNAALKAKRVNPNQLCAGDELYIPPMGLKLDEKPSSATHNFVRKGEPTKLKLALSMLGEPRKNEPYVLIFGDQVIHGTTDGEGKLEHFIPGQTKTATLRLKDGKEEYAVALGELDPIDLPKGVQQRLVNLGFPCDISGEIDESTIEAIKKFQGREQLPVTGQLDGATKAKLNELHV